MKKQTIKLFLMFSLSIISLCSFAQGTYWSETTTTPTKLIDKGNTCIAISPKNTLFVGTLLTGAFRSYDDGLTWERCLPIKDSAVVKIICKNNEEIFAIAGKTVYYSNNGGSKWLKYPVPTMYLLSDIELLDNGKVVVSSADLIDTAPGEHDYYGDGVFISSNNGKDWKAINNGIFNNKAITNLAVGNNNIMVASMAGLKPGDGCIYYSLNEGDQWNVLPMLKFRGKRSKDLFQPQSIYEVHCLELDRNENLYVSFDGSSGNFAMQGSVYANIYKAISDSTWKTMEVNKYGYDWQFHTFHSIYFAKQQAHVYTSLNTYWSVSYGGNYVKKENEIGFKRRISGIKSVMDSYLKMLYAENAKGRIYAVQYLDNKVYFTDSSASINTGFEYDKSKNISVFPNPSKSYISISGISEEEEIVSVKLFDLKGQLVQEEKELIKNQFVFDINKHFSGLYLINIQTDKSFYTKMISINN